MAHLFLRLTVSALCLGTCACRTAQGYPERAFNFDQELNMLADYYKPDILTKYSAAQDKRAFRDEVVYARIRAIDLRFGEFQQKLSKEGNWTNLGLDMTVLALSGAGTIVADAGTKGTLAALSGGFTGTKSAVDKTLFFNKTLPVILSQMEAKRTDALAKLLNNLNLDVDRYPLVAALTDLDKYYEAGTIPGALVSLTAASGQAVSESDQKLETVLEGKFSDDDPGRALRRFVRPDGKNLNQDNKAKLREWMDENGLGDVSITSFMYNLKFKEQRLMAVEDLSLTGNN
jgi:hypothetical protein